MAKYIYYSQNHGNLNKSYCYENFKRVTQSLIAILKSFHLDVIMVVFNTLGNSLQLRDFPNKRNKKEDIQNWWNNGLKSPGKG